MDSRLVHYVTELRPLMVEIVTYPLREYPAKAAVSPRSLGHFARIDVCTWAKEIYRDYSNSLPLSNASEILWSWILKIKSKFRLVVVLLIQPIAILMFSLPSPRGIFRKLKQQRRRRLRKRHLKSEFELPQTLSRLFHLVQFIKCWQFSLELNSKRLYRSSGKEKESRCLVLTSSIKREIRHFHVLVVQWRLRNKTKQRVARASGSFSRMNKWRVEDERTTDVPSYNFLACEQ